MGFKYIELFFGFADSDDSFNSFKEKTMKHFLVAAALIFASQAYASTIDVSTLSKEQQFAIQQQVQQLKQTPEAKVATAEKVLDFSEKFGKMIASTAREVGVATNEFVETPVGMLVAALIVWNYIGQDLVQLLFGSCIFVLGLYFVSRVYKNWIASEIVYDLEKPTNFFGKHPVKSIKTRTLGGDEIIGLLGMALLITIAAGLITFARNS